MTAVLGNMTPDPTNAGGEAAVNRLSQVLENLVNKLGAGGGTKGSGSAPWEQEDKKRAARYKLEEQIYKQTYDALARLAAYRRKREQALDVLAKSINAEALQAERNKKRAQDSLNAQRSRALNAEMKALEVAEKSAQRRIDAENQRNSKQQVRKTQSAAERMTNLLDTIGDKLANGGVLKESDRRKMARAGVYSGIQQTLEKTSQANKSVKESKTEAKDLEKLEAYWLRREASERAIYKARIDAVTKARQDIQDKLQGGGKVSLKDARRLDRLGDSVGASGVRSKLVRDKAITEQQELADIERSYLRKDERSVAKWKRQQQDKLDSKRETEREFATKIYGRINRGRNVTEGNLERAQQLGLKGLVGQITAQLQKQKDTAAQKRVEDFEIQQHNKQVDNERKAKAKAEREAKGTGPSKQGGSFFGGFGRNMVIGRLYAVTNAVIAPMEAFVSGALVPAMKAWKELTKASLEAGKNLAYTSGMASAAAQVENVLKQKVARLESRNAQYGMVTDIGGRTAAGMMGSSASLSKGVGGAIGNAMDNPLTGLNEIVNQIGNAVGMADPGAMVRYNMVLRDLTATIGQGLAPVINMITRLMKEFGDYLQPVVQEMVPKITEVLGKLFEAIKPLIPLFVKELTDTIKELVDLIGQIGGKLGLREMIIRGVGGPNALALANAGGAGVGGGKAALGFGAGALEGAAIGGIGGAAFGPVGSAIGAAGGALIGGAAGFLGATEPDANAGGPAGIGGMLNQLANMKKGNIAGAAVAQNATIGSGSDLARRASQEAFIASSAKGNIDPMQQLFQQAAQGAINFFQGALKPKPVANGNGQAGIAPGKGEGAMEFGAGQGSFQKVARSMLSGMVNPFGVFG